MSNQSLDYFGQWLIGSVRERACEMLRDRALGRSTDRISRIFRDLYLNHPGCDASIVEPVGLVAIDLVLDSLLTALDQDSSIGLAFSRMGNETVELKQASDGLAGELYGREGWFAKHAKTRSLLT